MMRSFLRDRDVSGMSHVADAMVKRIGGRSGQRRGKATPEDRAALLSVDRSEDFGVEQADMKEQTLSPAERGPALCVCPSCSASLIFARLSRCYRCEAGDQSTSMDLSAAGEFNRLPNCP